MSVRSTKMIDDAADREARIRELEARFADANPVKIKRPHRNANETKPKRCDAKVEQRAMEAEQAETIGKWLTRYRKDRIRRES